MAHWILPSAFSIALVEKTLPAAKSLRSDNTMTCLSLAIWTNGPAGLMTKPNHVLISERTVFYQLRGTPSATRKARSAGVSEWQFVDRRIQQKSSTKTKPQSTSGNAQYINRNKRAAIRPQYSCALATP